MKKINIYVNEILFGNIEAQDSNVESAKASILALHPEWINYRFEEIDITNQIAYNQYYSERSKRLTDTDWTQLNDCALTPACIQSFKGYRKALRLLRKTITIENAESVIWPTIPVIEYQDEYKKQGEI